MVPKLIARDPWNDSAAACKAKAAMRGCADGNACIGSAVPIRFESGPKGLIGRHSRR